MLTSIKANLPQRFDMNKLGEEIAAASGPDVGFMAKLSEDGQSIVEFLYEIPEGADYDPKKIEAAITSHTLAPDELDDVQKSEAAAVESLTVLDRLAALEERMAKVEGKLK